jgi:hypothetical protein
VIRLAGKPQSAADAIVERIFAPPPAKAKVGGAQVVDEKLAKQEALISFMERQVQELTEARKQKLGTMKRKATGQEGTREPPLSEGCNSAYFEMLEAFAPDLRKNSEEVEMKLRKEPNYNGLRAAVIRLLHADQSASDTELSQRLLSERS